MIYTIGYEKLTQKDLIGVAFRLNAIVVDVRSRPSGRVKRGFSRADLTLQLGNQYVWKGEALGGMGVGITPEGLDWLREFAKANNVMLLCKEEQPIECHRHSIALQLEEDVIHIFQDEACTARSLQDAVDGKIDNVELIELPDLST